MKGFLVAGWPTCPSTTRWVMPCGTSCRKGKRDGFGAVNGSRAACDAHERGPTTGLRQR